MNNFIIAIIKNELLENLKATPQSLNWIEQGAEQEAKKSLRN